MDRWVKKNGSLVIRVVGTLTAIGLLAYLVNQNGTRDIQQTLMGISPTSLAISFGFILLSRLFITIRWHILLRTGGVEIPFRRTLLLVFMGLFSNNFLPTTVGGDVVKLAAASQMGYDKAITLASIAADRLINMIGMSLAAPLGLWQFFSSGVILQGFTLGGLFSKTFDFLKKTLGSFSLWLKKPGAIAAALLCALVHMFFSFAAIYVLILGMGEEMSFWEVIGLSSLAYFITLVPLSINGYGLQEFSVTFLFSNIGGISVATAASTAVIHRLMMILVSLPGAFTLPGILGKINQPEQKDL